MYVNLALEKEVCWFKDFLTVDKCGTESLGNITAVFEYGTP